jgi:hypothetical protein
MSDIRALSGISDVEISELYAGKDVEQNEAQLRQLVQERTGVDLLGYTRDYEERVTRETLDRYRDEFVEGINKAYDYVLKNSNIRDKIDALHDQVKIIFGAKIEAFYAQDKPANATIDA